jgi:hypothetical protein
MKEHQVRAVHHETGIWLVAGLRAGTASRSPGTEISRQPPSNRSRASHFDVQHRRQTTCQLLQLPKVTHRREGRAAGRRCPGASLRCRHRLLCSRTHARLPQRGRVPVWGQAHLLPLAVVEGAPEQGGAQVEQQLAEGGGGLLAERGADGGEPGDACRRASSGGGRRPEQAGQGLLQGRHTGGWRGTCTQ